MKPIRFLPLLLALLLVACNAVDRSGEQPFAPTVETLDAESVGDSALLHGAVVASPNSDVKECGFTYGNDTLETKVKCAEAATLFSAYTDSLAPGTYFAVAYSRNGIGTSWGDTVRFVIGE